MKRRVQVLLTPEERERFRTRAEAEGASLSGWLKEAGMQRLARERERRRIDGPDGLRAFFRACDARTEGRGREPDWAEHLEVMRESRRQGIPDA